MHLILKFSVLIFLVFATTIPICLANTFSIGGPIDFIYLQVGTGTLNGNNTNINKASASVTQSSNGNGIPILMISNSDAIGPFAPGTLTCSLPNQIYVSARHRRTTATASNATLQVATPATLTGSTGSIPITEVDWITDGSAGIVAGNFTSSSKVLGSLGKNIGIENCLTFRYLNTTIVSSGTYTAQATYSLVAP